MSLTLPTSALHIHFLFTSDPVYNSTIQIDLNLPQPSMAPPPSSVACEKLPMLSFIANILCINRFPTVPRYISLVNISAYGNPPTSVPTDSEIFPVNKATGTVPRVNEAFNPK